MENPQCSSLEGLWNIQHLLLIMCFTPFIVTPLHHYSDFILTLCDQFITLLEFLFLNWCLFLFFQLLHMDQLSFLWCHVVLEEEKQSPSAALPPGSPRPQWHSHGTRTQPLCQTSSSTLQSSKTTLISESVKSKWADSSGTQGGLSNVSSITLQEKCEEILYSQVRLMLSYKSLIFNMSFLFKFTFKQPPFVLNDHTNLNVIYYLQ